MLIPADSYAVMRCKIFFCPNSQQLTLDLEAETLIVLFGNPRFWFVVKGEKDNFNKIHSKLKGEGKSNQTLCGGVP